MTMSLPLSLHPSLADVPGLDETVDEVLELHAEHARLRARILCDARQDAVEVKRELVKKYGEPNIAAQPARPQDVALEPLADKPLPLPEPNAFSIDLHDEDIGALFDKAIEQPDVRALVRRLPWTEWATTRGVSGRLNRAAADVVHAAICDAIARADISLDQATEIALATLREAETNPVRYLIDAFGRDLPQRLQALAAQTSDG